MSIPSFPSIDRARLLRILGSIRRNSVSFTKLAVQTLVAVAKSAGNFSLATLMIAVSGYGLMFAVRGVRLPDAVLLKEAIASGNDPSALAQRDLYLVGLVLAVVFLLAGFAGLAEWWKSLTEGVRDDEHRS